MIAWLCKIDPATDYNGREVIMDSELEFLDSFNVNGGGGNKFQVDYDSAQFIGFVPANFAKGRPEQKMSLFPLNNPQSPFACLPAHLTAESSDKELLKYTKKLRPKIENDWWDAIFNPENTYVQMRLDAFAALSRPTTPKPQPIPQPKNTRGRHKRKRSAALSEKSSGKPAVRHKVSGSSKPLQVKDEELEEGEIEEEGSPTNMITHDGKQWHVVGEIESDDDGWEFEDSKIRKDRVYSEPRRSVKDTRTLLNAADLKLWKAYKTTFTCDGVTKVEGSDFCLPKFQVSLFVDLFNKGKGPASASETLGFGTRSDSFKHPEDTLFEFPNKPFTILDNDGIPLVFHIPNYYSQKQTERFTQHLLAFSDYAKLVRKQADACGRGNPASYVVRDGHPAGCINMASSWVAIGHDQNDPRPSAAMINGMTGGTVEAFSAIQEHFDQIRLYNVLMNYALRMLDHRSFWDHFNMKCKIQERNVAARPFAPNDPAMATGRSNVYNRITELHFDTKEHHAAWSPLQILGTCTTGYLALPQLGIKLPYLPGTLTFIRGHFLAHGVTGWEKDGDRICIANFNHQTEWKHAEVVPQFYKP